MIMNFTVLYILIMQVCRPGSGPLNGNERNSPRRPNWEENQRTVYQGWKHFHGVKVQTVSLPNGMIGSMYGIQSARHNDRWMLCFSALRQIVRGLTNRFSLYGDSIYVTSDVLRTPFRGDDLAQYEIEENTAMKAIRIAIEWDYGRLNNHWPGAVRRKKQLMLHCRNDEDTEVPANCDDEYWCALFLLNVKCCFEWNSGSSYFSVSPPDIESYLGWE